jgi:hypothetical protein
MAKGLSRRRLFATTALGGLGAILGIAAARPARALTMQPMDAEAKALYLTACSARDGSYHRELVAEAKQRLAGRASEAEIEAAIAAMTCPVCGCPITTN